MAGQLTIDPGYFERIYAESDDPWDFEGSWYERRKYDLTLASLPEAHYKRAFEPGCSLGVLSERLARRCDELVCMELMPSIAEVARERLRAFPGVSVLEGAMPDSWPSGSFDLLILSEIAYYLTAEGLELAIARIRESLTSGGTLVSVHYTLETDYPLTGKEVGTRLREVPWLTEIARYSERSFELLVLQS